MELTVAKPDLLRLLTRACGVADRKATTPALAHVKLVANGRLELAATDLYLSLVGHIDAEIKKQGAVTVAARDLLDRVKMMPEGPIAISATDSGLTIKAPGSSRRYKLGAGTAEDFPSLPSAEGVGYELAAETLAELIARTSYSVSNDDTRPHLASALFELDNGKIRMVSTDGHRLSLHELDYEITGKHSLLIPRKALAEIRRLTDAGDPIIISVTDSTAFFEAGGVTFSTRLTDAQFPPYKQVIPAKQPNKAKVDRLALLDVVKAVALSASATNNGVRLEIKNGLVRVTASSPDHGDGEDEVAAETSGEPVKIGFNASYLVDALGACGGGEVTLTYAGELDPLCFRDGSYLAVTMPMRI